MGSKFWWGALTIVIGVFSPHSVVSVVEFRVRGVKMAVLTNKGRPLN